MSRNTRTGSVLERMLLPALEQGGYSYRVQARLGRRLGVGRHVVDAVAEKDGRQILISKHEIFVGHLAGAAYFVGWTSGPTTCVSVWQGDICLKQM